jgi:DNA polymerase III epsilon subunit-like protein
MFPFILEGHLLKGPPASVLFVDVETTGLRGADRIVSLGAIRLPTFEMWVFWIFSG